MKVVGMRMLKCCVTRMDKIKNGYIKRSFDVTNIAGKIRDILRLRCFSNVEKRNIYDIIKKISEIRVKGNMGKGRTQKMWMGVIGEGMRTCG